MPFQIRTGKPVIPSSELVGAMMGSGVSWAYQLHQLSNW